MPVPVLANIIGDLFNGFLDILGFVLAFFYRFIPSIGIAIILLTVVLRLLVWPLTAKQAKSMLAMQRAQPEIKRLQAKYKDDRQKLNEEMMKFYKENEINPFGGCLPLLLQMPIFIGLFRLLNNIPKHIPKTGAFSSMYSAICDAKGAACLAKTPVYKLPFFPNGMFDLHLSAGKGHDSLIAALPASTFNPPVMRLATRMIPITGIRKDSHGRASSGLTGLEGCEAQGCGCTTGRSADASAPKGGKAPRSEAGCPASAVCGTSVRHRSQTLRRFPGGCGCGTGTGCRPSAPSARTPPARPARAPAS